MKKVIFTLILGAIFLSAKAQFKMPNATKTVKTGTKVVKAATLSDAEVISICKQYADYLDKLNKVEPEKSEYTKRLRKLTDKHLKEEGLPEGVVLNFKVYRASDINAFALADGSIRVCMGIMDFMTDDELLGVIGHEIGHVKNRDTRDRIRSAYLSSAAMDVATSQGGAVGAISNSDLGKLAEALTNAQFSQKQEKSADDHGLDFLYKHGYDVNAMASAFRKLAEVSKGGGSKLLSTHPDPGKRAERMEVAAKKLKKK